VQAIVEPGGLIDPDRGIQRGLERAFGQQAASEQQEQADRQGHDGKGDAKGALHSRFSQTILPQVACAAPLRQALCVETSPAIESTLLALQPALALTRQPWWILGSAAVALHGGDPGEVRDIDLLLDRQDHAAVVAGLGLVPSAGESDGRFRSDWFNRWTGAALPVDLFAGFHLLADGVWQEALPHSRVAVQAGGITVHVPDRQELAVLLARFGRDKDLRRIAALSRISRSPSRSGSA